MPLICMHARLVIVQQCYFFKTYVANFSPRNISEIIRLKFVTHCKDTRLTAAGSRCPCLPILLHYYHPITSSHWGTPLPLEDAQALPQACSLGLQLPPPVAHSVLLLPHGPYTAYMPPQFRALGRSCAPPTLQPAGMINIRPS